jgi:hypothetical protein
VYGDHDHELARTRNSPSPALVNLAATKSALWLAATPASRDDGRGPDLLAASRTGPEASQSGRKRPWWLPDVVAVAALLAFALALCSPILSGKVPVASDTLALWPPWSQLPHAPISNPDIADSALVSLPWTVFERASIADGEWPLWDPYSFSGASFAANSQNQLYYPLTWILWLLPLAGSIQVLTLSNIWLAGTGMYMLCRHFRTSRTGAFSAALGFAGSGMLQLAIELPGPATSYGWLPWMLLATDRALQVRTPGRVALAALACGVQLVSGNLQWAIYSYFALALWVLWRSKVPFLQREWRNVRSTFLVAFGTLVGGLALATVHLAPVLEMVGLSTRSETVVSSHSAPLTDLLRLLMPQYFGISGSGVGAPLVFNDLWYVGIGLLVLALLAVVLPCDGSKWLWCGLALFAVCVAYGIGPFLYVRWLPGLSGLLPSRIGYLFIFSVCLLAALGFDAWIAACKRSPRHAALALLAAISLPAIACLCAQLYATGTVNPALLSLRGQQIARAILLLGAVTLTLILPLVGTLIKRVWNDEISVVRLSHLAACASIIAVLILDLTSVAPAYNEYTDATELAPRSPSVDWLMSQPGFGRVMGLGIKDKPAVLVPNVQTLFGFQSVAGYDSVHSARYEAYWSAVDPSVRPAGNSTPYSNVFVRPQVYSSTMADLLNVRYVASAADLVAPVGLKKIYTGEISIYENERALPRAFVPDTSLVIPSNRILDTMVSPTFDAAHTLLLEAEDSPPRLPATAGSQVPPGVVTVTRYGRDSVQIEADIARPGWVVLGDQNYPGWSATIDGQSQQVYTADYLLRAIPVQEGHHSIVFSFLPSNYGLTLAISVVACSVSLLLIVANGWPFKRKRAQGQLIGPRGGKP